MNFNYSYKAFLFSLLLVGGLILFMYLIKLPKMEVSLENNYPLEYAPDELIPKDESATAATNVKKIETHRAFNEAKKFISELEKESIKQSKTTAEKLSEMDNAIENSSNNVTILINEVDEVLEENNKIDQNSSSESNNRNSTNSFRLVDRTALFFPNPVYTCESRGKIVLNIEVNNKGEVVYLSINESSSTTNNECLIDSALEYAKKTRFSTSKNKPQQLGSITYVFPGQG